MGKHRPRIHRCYQCKREEKIAYSSLDRIVFHFHCLEYFGGSCDWLIDNGIGTTWWGKFDVELVAVESWWPQVHEAIRYAQLPEVDGGYTSSEWEFDYKRSAVLAARDPQVRAMILDDAEAALLMLEAME